MNQNEPISREELNVFIESNDRAHEVIGMSVDSLIELASIQNDNIAKLAGVIERQPNKSFFIIKALVSTILVAVLGLAAWQINHDQREDMQKDIYKATQKTIANQDQILKSICENQILILQQKFGKDYNQNLVAPQCKNYIN